MDREEDEGGNPLSGVTVRVTVSTRCNCNTGRCHVVAHDLVVIGFAPEANVQR